MFVFSEGTAEKETCHLNAKAILAKPPISPIFFLAAPPRHAIMFSTHFSHRLTLFYFLVVSLSFPLVFLCTFPSIFYLRSTTQTKPHRPRMNLLVLDEPLMHLDAEGKQRFASVIEAIDKSTVIVVAQDVCEEVASKASSIDVILRRGDQSTVILSE